jgi:hypothetical protein
MWRNIGQLTQQNLIDSANMADRQKHHHVSVDCSGANRGLFFGIFTLVAVIISMIVFFVLIEKPGFVKAAVMIVYVSELVLYFLAMIALFVAAYRLRDMRFHWNIDNALDEVLLMISLLGVYLFSVFSIIAGRYNTDTYGGTLVMVTGIVIMLEATIQTVFILNGLRRSSRTNQHETKKPGREYITFVLVCNIAMWGINTFEVLRSGSNPVALHFYGSIPWSIITHIATPLAIFYRFHSTVCLATIWKNAYKQKCY